MKKEEKIEKKWCMSLLREKKTLYLCFEWQKEREPS